MAEWFVAALSAYRAKAAHSKRTFKAHGSALNPQLRTKLTPYVRTFIPGLEEYLVAAAARYLAFKDCSVCPVAKRIRRAPVLGSGDAPVLSLAADVRRQRWLTYLSVREHKRRQQLYQPSTHSFVITAVSSGIPHDIRKLRQERYVRFCNKAVLTFPERPLGSTLPPHFVPSELLAEHVERCRASLRAHELRLRSRIQTAVLVDTFDEVKNLYAGKPDEIYRRKTSRRFAAWRRRQAEQRVADAKRVTDAERLMQSTRGLDHLLTSRKTGDKSFAPFLFDLDSHAYAFSSRITEAPKLRKAMIKKYSAQEKGDSVDSWAKAHEAAQTKELFHTRVMNRFG